MINIDNEIKKALLEKNKVRRDALRMIKAAFIEFKTAKNAKPFDDAAEIGILKKMVAQRKDSASEYMAAGRKDLADKENAEIEVIKEYLPAEVSKEDILKAAREVVKEKEMRLMGGYIKEIKALFPGADGKDISEIVKSIINE